MTEIERILKEEIEKVNKAERRDNRPRLVPDALVDSILQSPQVDDSRKQKLRAIMQKKSELSFYDIFAVGQNRSPV